MITCNFPNNSCKYSIDDTHSLSCLKFLNLRWHYDYILCLRSTDNLQTLYLVIWYDERFFDKSFSFVSMTIIKTEVGEVYVIVNK